MALLLVTGRSNNQDYLDNVVSYTQILPIEAVLAWPKTIKEIQTRVSQILSLTELPLPVFRCGYMPFRVIRKQGRITLCTTCMIYCL